MMERELSEMLLEAAGRWARSKGLKIPEGTRPVVERPPRPELGDYATNFALHLAKALGMKPREVAEGIVANLPGSPYIESVEVAGPGFINFRLNPAWVGEVIKRVLAEGERYGAVDVGKGRKVQVEFVSANPTGPLHIGHGRGAAIGDVIARLLEFTGHKVTREYYINDAERSRQMRLFAESLEARYLQVLGKESELPPDGYHGEYILDIARRIAEEHGERLLQMSREERLRALMRIGRDMMVKEHREDLERFRVRFDVWFSEQSLYDSGEIWEAMELLRKSGHTYEADGALWLRSTDFGDDKDRVLIRQDGSPTYLASDLAYHRNKFRRGFDLVIDIWGPDHHGYIARTKAGLDALGLDARKVEIFVHQIVRLTAGGEPVRMSKREGELVTLRQLMDEVGVDAARFFFLMRSADSHLDFDLELAKKESAENPVYYVQYAHARLCSLFREAEERAVEMPDPEKVDFSLLSADEEKALALRLSEFPSEVEAAARRREPHRIVNYARELAKCFHLFYDRCPVLAERPKLRDARLLLCKATHIVLKNVLNLLGVSAPERM